jgi:predicted porin
MVNKTVWGSTIALFLPLLCHAQNSVTLYGAIDEDLLYQSSSSTLGANAGGKSNWTLTSGGYMGSRWGIRGSEALGDGMHTVFQLENGFNQNTGMSQQGGLEFGRQAYVGISSDQLGTVTLGRQYTPYFDLLQPFTPTTWLAMHPGDIDAMDFIYHTNSSIKYRSPSEDGFTVAGLYALAGIPGSVARGSTWSVAGQYTSNLIGGMVGIFRINNAAPGGGPFDPNSTSISGTVQAGVSALTNGYSTAQSQQRIASALQFKFYHAMDLTLTYSNTQYIPGADSLFHDTAIFNTAGIVFHKSLSFDLDLAAGYSCTWTTKANGISDSAIYQQATLTEFYSLSKRTALYAFQGYQRAGGSTLGTSGAGHIINATASYADYFNGAPSSSRSQFAAAIGILQKF